jgi:hypothetical protein
MRFVHNLMRVVCVVTVETAHDECEGSISEERRTAVKLFLGESLFHCMAPRFVECSPNPPASIDVVK